MRRSLVAGGVLLGVYVCLSFLNATGGYLGTDTGGKVATLEAMTAGPGISVDPDLGYWAERWDPDGSLYPVYFTSHIGDRWVNVTTFPMLLAALPLYDLGGYRLALLLPMAGSVAAALTAAALAARLGGPRWPAFWIVGLASPMTIYALDFWEHSVGVALMAGAVVLLWDLVEVLSSRPSDRPIRWQDLARAAGAGALLGAAATMRTEALVVTAAAALVVAGALFRRGVAPARVVAGGAVAATPFVLVLGANQLLERWLLGSGLRVARASATAAIAGDAPSDRLAEAAITVAGASGSARGVALGAVMAALIAYGCWRHKADPAFGTAAVAAAGALFVVRAFWGLGFVPGLFVAWPLAAAAAVPAVWRRAPVPAAVAAVSIPIVLATQFRGGAQPQWAGRYLLVSGVLLTVTTLGSWTSLDRRFRSALATLAVVVTAFGVAWTSVRTHQVERAVAAIESRPEPVIVSTVAHLAREGAVDPRGGRWLTAATPALREEAAAVATRAGHRRLLLVERAGGARQAGQQRDLPGWRRAGSSTIPLFDGVPLRLTTWERRSS